jgi:hypothetical protein
MPKLEPCKSCGHPRHAHGERCTVSSVSGPASAKGRRVGDGYEHTARTVTPCRCEGYVSERNGVHV